MQIVVKASRVARDSFIKKNLHLDTKELAEKLYVSTVTVRNDLTRLKSSYPELFKTAEKERAKRQKSVQDNRTAVIRENSHLTAQEISYILNVSDATIRRHAAKHNITIKPLRPSCTGIDDRMAFMVKNPHLTIREMASKLGITSKAVLSFAYRHKIPFKHERQSPTHNMSYRLRFIKNNIDKTTAEIAELLGLNHPAVYETCRKNNLSPKDIRENAEKRRIRRPSSADKSITARNTLLTAKWA